MKPNLVELLTRISSVGFDEAIADAKVVIVEGRRVPVIGRAALLRNKRGAARPKDLDDVDWLDSDRPFLRSGPLGSSV